MKFQTEQTLGYVPKNSEYRFFYRLLAQTKINIRFGNFIHFQWTFIGISFVICNINMFAGLKSIQLSSTVWLTYANVLHCISCTVYCASELSLSSVRLCSKPTQLSPLQTDWLKSQRNFHSEHKRFKILCKMKLAWGYMTISLHILVLCMFGWFYRFCLLNQFVIQLRALSSHELTAKNVWFCKKATTKKRVSLLFYVLIDCIKI